MQGLTRNVRYKLMSQAENATTTTRVRFSSAGALPPQASAGVSGSTPGIRGAHADLITRLQALPPYRFDPRLQATPDQLELQADILRCNLRAMAQYVVAFVRDTADHTYAIHTDRLYLNGLFVDIIGDLCGAIESAAETVREEGVYVGSAA